MNPSNRNWNDSHSSAQKLQMNGWKDKRNKKKYFVANSAKCYVLIITYGCRRSQPSLPSIEQTRHAMPLSNISKRFSIRFVVIAAVATFRCFFAIKMCLRVGNRLISKTTKKWKTLSKNSWLIVIWYMSYKNCNLYSKQRRSIT